MKVFGAEPGPAQRDRRDLPQGPGLQPEVHRDVSRRCSSRLGWNQTLKSAAEPPPGIITAAPAAPGCGQPGPGVVAGVRAARGRGGLEFSRGRGRCCWRAGVADAVPAPAPLCPQTPPARSSASVRRFSEPSRSGRLSPVAYLRHRSPRNHHSSSQLILLLIAAAVGPSGSSAATPPSDRIGHRPRPPAWQTRRRSRLRSPATRLACIERARCHAGGCRVRPPDPRGVAGTPLPLELMIVGAPPTGVRSSPSPPTCASSATQSVAPPLTRPAAPPRREPTRIALPRHPCSGDRRDGPGSVTPGAPPSSDIAPLRALPPAVVPDLRRRCIAPRGAPRAAGAGARTVAATVAPPPPPPHARPPASAPSRAIAFSPTTSPDLGAPALPAIETTGVVPAIFARVLPSPARSAVPVSLPRRRPVTGSERCWPRRPAQTVAPQTPRRHVPARAGAEHFPQITSTRSTPPRARASPSFEIDDPPPPCC